MRQDNDRVFPEIEEYMERHDFIPADRFKVRRYINRYNRKVRPSFRITDGRLTRTDLVLRSRGMDHYIARELLRLKANLY